MVNTKKENYWALSSVQENPKELKIQWSQKKSLMRDIEIQKLKIWLTE